MPQAATAKVAVCPADHRLIRRLRAMLGATGSAFTVSVAALLVVVPPEFRCSPSP